MVDDRARLASTAMALILAPSLAAAQATAPASPPTTSTTPSTTSPPQSVPTEAAPDPGSPPPGVRTTTDTDPDSGTTAAVDSDDAGGIKDIIVTAERRSVSAQSAPLAITALGGDELARRNITDPADLTAAIPGLKATAGTINLSFSLRGVGSSQSGPTGQGGVATYIDGIYLVRPAQRGILLDTNRVEVLFGPQGTLYGRGATGGAVNIISNRPNNLLSFSGSVEVGNYDAVVASGAFNVPITDWLYIRTAVQRITRDGYFSNGFSNQRETTARVQLLAKPAPGLQILLQVLADQSNDLGPGQVLTPFVGDPFDRNTNPPTTVQRQNRRHFTGQIDYDLGFATVTYLGVLTRAPQLQDNWFNNGQQLRVDTKDRWNQQELRLTSSADGPFKWTVGGFYLGTNTYYTNFNYINRGFQEQTNDQDSYAAYGQATYSVTPKLRVTGGLRYTRDTIDQTVRIQTATGLAAGPINARSEYKATNWKLGTDWDVGERSLLYVNVGDGYRPGGINASPPPDNQFQPETVMHYEIGSKNRFFDGRLQINGNVYYDSYGNYFVGGVLPLKAPFAALRAFTVNNAGDATIKGAALDAIFAPTPNDTFGVAVNYLDATFKTFIADGVDYSGQTIPNSPKWTVDFGYEHKFDLGSTGNVIARVDNYYTTKFDVLYQRVQYKTQEGFLRTNLNLTYNAPDRAVSVGLFARNIQDKRTLTYGGLSGVRVYQAFEAPRTYGARLGFRF